MIIDFVRHGQSIANAEGWTAGAQDIVLTQQGRYDARELAHDMAEHDKQYDLIVSSHLSRAHETARYIAVALGYDQRKIMVVDELCERYHGALENQPNERVESTTEQEGAEAGQETVQEFYRRVTAGLEQVIDRARRQSAEKILIVAHAGTYRVLKMIVEEMPLDTYNLIKRTPNTTLMRIYTS